MDALTIHGVFEGAEPTVADGIDQYYDGYYRTECSMPGNAAAYVREIHAAFDRMPMSKLTGMDVLRWKNQLKEHGLSDATCHRYLQFLRAGLNFLKDNGWTIPEVKISKFIHKEKRRVEPLAGADINRILESPILNNPRYSHVLLFVRIATETGMRKTEILSLKWSEVNLERGQITLLDTKTGEVQHVEITEKLKGILSATPRQGEYVVTHNGKPIHDIRHAFQAVMKASGIERHVWPHLLRHTFAGQMLMAGATIKAVQEALRHKSAVLTLDTYGHINRDFLKSQVNLIADRWN